MCPSWNIRIEGLGACCHLSHLEKAVSTLKSEKRSGQAEVTTMVPYCRHIHTVTCDIWVSSPTQGGGGETASEPKTQSLTSSVTCRRRLLLAGTQPPEQGSEQQTLLPFLPSSLSLGCSRYVCDPVAGPRHGQ